MVLTMGTIEDVFHASYDRSQSIGKGQALLLDNKFYNIIVAARQ